MFCRSWIFACYTGNSDVGASFVDTLCEKSIHIYIYTSISHPSSNIYVIYHCLLESSYFPRARPLCRARKPLFDRWIIQIRRLDPRMKITAGQSANKRVCHLRSTCFTLCAASISRIFSLASPTDFMRSILRRKNDLSVYFSFWNTLAEVCFWRSNAIEICENRFIDLVFVV